MSDYPCGGTRREQELMLYVGGELRLWERLWMEQHLRNCPSCRRQERLMLSTMQSVAAEVRGGALPHWQAQGLMVSASAISGRFQPKPLSGTRLAALAAASAAVAALTSYMAATYADRLTPSRFAPLSRASIVASPPCKTPVGSAAKACRDCASPAPKLTPR